MPIIITDSTLQKLKEKHQVSGKEVEDCFHNRTGELLEDTRDQHRTEPPTQWFIAPTNKGRLLKICFINRKGNVSIRTAYPANPIEIELYRNLGKPHDF